MRARERQSATRRYGPLGWRSRRTRAWIAVIVWLAVVWTLGGDAFSAAFTASVLRPIIEFFLTDFSSADMFQLLTVIRKSMHVVVYGLLSLFTLRALWIGAIRSVFISLGLTAVLVTATALADEIRQASSPVRTGSGFDVVLDLIGAAVVAAVLVGMQAMRRDLLFAPERGPLTQDRGPLTPGREPR
jgi:VanZ family protein